MNEDTADARLEIYEITRDIPELEAGHEIWSERYAVALRDMLGDPEAKGRAVELKARDDFAAGRLDLLKSLEGSSAEEKRRLLQMDTQPTEVSE
ncbi:MAG: hypothetical protein JW808_09265 [Victivallales bacterium]|nr:hypothetical protein [Victivallales bacterium]